MGIKDIIYSTNGVFTQTNTEDKQLIYNPVTKHFSIIARAEKQANQQQTTQLRI